MRLVCTDSGVVGVDMGGKKQGRGAYLCTATECWEKGLKKGILERALRVTLSPDNRLQLVEFGRRFSSPTTEEQK